MSQQQLRRQNQQEQHLSINTVRPQQKYLQKININFIDSKTKTKTKPNWRKSNINMNSNTNTNIMTIKINKLLNVECS